MKYETIKAVFLSNQRSDHRLFRINTKPEFNGFIVDIYYGAKIISYPTGKFDIEINCRSLSGPAVDLINMVTPDNFVLKKNKPRTYKLGESWLGQECKFHVKADGTWFNTNDCIIANDEELKEKTKALHVLTRRVRKKVQPQIRLLGPEPFKPETDERGYRKYQNRGDLSEVDALMNVLDGKAVVQNLKLLCDLCDMEPLFGQGNRWSRNGTSEFQPKKIIDKILRRVSANKLAILEKYDERNRKAANRSKGNTRRAA